MGHHDHHHDPAKDQRTTLVLAAIVIAAFLGGAFWLTRQGLAAPPAPEQLTPIPAPAQGAAPPAEDQSGQAQAQEPATPATPAQALAAAQPEPDIEGALGKGAPTKRSAMAKTLSDKYESRGRLARARATGSGDKTFEVYWPGRVDETHLTDLKTAQPLFANLRGQGFEKVVMRVRDRVVWSRDL